MKKIIFALTTTTFLVGCTTTEKNIDENLYVMDPNWTQVEVLSPSQVKTQPDEFIQELQTIKDLPPSASQQKAGDDMQLLAQELRKELRSTGVKVKEVSGQIDLVIPNDISFGQTQKAILPDFSEKLSAVATLLKKYDKTMIQIIGYTDDTLPVLIGKESSSQKANEIAAFLKDHGVESGRIITDGAGSDNPVANNITPSGRAQNRRIEITLISLQ